MAGINNTKLMSTWPKLIIKKCFFGIKKCHVSIQIKKINLLILTKQKKIKNRIKY